MKTQERSRSAEEESADAARPRWYLYAIMDAAGGRAICHNESDGLHELCVVEHAGICAVVGPVSPDVSAAAESLASWSGRTVPDPTEPHDHSQRGGEDPATAIAALEPAVRTHEAVVEGLLGHGPLLPMRFGTVLQGPDNARALLDAHATDFRRQLEAVRNRREWGVKVRWHLRSAEAAAAASRRPGPDDGATEPGHSYLAARRRELAASAATARACEEQARVLAGILAALAPGHWTIGQWPEKPGAPDDAPVVRILEGAFLVAKEEEGRFIDCLEQHASAVDGLRAELSGPWPPYSFVQPIGAAP